MKTIKTANYKDIEELNIKTFNGKNYKEILNAFKSLPHQNYEMEMFEMNDNKGIVLSFNDDLHIKVMNEDRGNFENHFGIKTSDHIMVDVGRYIKND